MNEARAKQEMLTVVIQTFAVPGPPAELSVKMKNSTCLVLDWEAPDRANGKITGYKVKTADMVSVRNNPCMCGKSKTIKCRNHLICFL